MSAVFNEDTLNEDDDFRSNGNRKSDPGTKTNKDSSKSENQVTSWRKYFASDFLASIVVFLVALPLCMGIAIASGVSPALGIITGIIGGIIVGTFAGSPLLVSGPAAGLAVIIWELVQQHGIVVLGPIVLLAGIFQMICSSRDLI